MLTATPTKTAGTRMSEVSIGPDPEAFLDNLPIGIYRSTPDGRVVYANRTLIHMLGYASLDEFRQLDLQGEAYPPSYDRPSMMARLDREGEIRGLEAMWRRQDGSILYIRENTRVVRSGSRILYYEGTVEDVTERRHAEQAAEERERRIRIQNQALTEIARGRIGRSADLDSALREVTEVAARTLQVERVSVWFYNEDRSRIRCTDLFELSRNVHSGGPELSAAEHPNYFRALLAERVIPADDAQADPRTKEFAADYLRPLGIASLMDAPVWTKGRTVGVVRHEEVGPLRAWAAEEQSFAASVADAVALILESIERDRAEQALRQLNQELEERVGERTAELEVANKELEAFSYSASHDLRAPLRTIEGFSQALHEDHYEKLDEDGRHLLDRIRWATKRMGRLIDDMLNLARVTRAELRRESVNLSGLARAAAASLRQQQPERDVRFVIADGVVARGDPNLLRVVVENLLSNAWKFTSRHAAATIEFGREMRDGQSVFFVRDDGAGFDMSHSSKLFHPFQRLHRITDFEGSGIGLATIHRILQRHGGKVWAEGAPEKGATFYFTLPGPREVA